MAAILLPKPFTEVSEQLDPTTVAFILAVLHHPAQHLSLPILLLLAAFTLFDETVETCCVLVTIIEVASGLFPIPACSTCLLIVAFQAFWNGMMYHKTHISLINAHSESNCSNNDVNF